MLRAFWRNREPSCGCWCGLRALCATLRACMRIASSAICATLPLWRRRWRADVVFHVAADYRLWVRDPDAMYRSNVEGTRSVLEAARKQGVRRVVYTSSVATIGFTLNHAAAELSSAGQV